MIIVMLALSPVVWIATFVSLFSLTWYYNEQFVMLLYWLAGAAGVTLIFKGILLYERLHRC